MKILINYHSTLVELLLFVLVLNILVPTLLKNREISFIKWTRIGYFAFWASWAMVAFSGLIVFVFQKALLKIDVYFMIAAIFALAILDGYRAIKQRKYWLNGTLALRFSNIVVAVEIAIVLITTYISVKF